MYNVFQIEMEMKNHYNIVKSKRALVDETLCALCEVGSYRACYDSLLERLPMLFVFFSLPIDD